MAIGTAGFTAMLAIDTLERHGLGTDAPISSPAPPAASGSTAVGLLATLGYEVTASTGRVDTESAALQALGAAHVIDRAEIADAPERPLLSERWGGAVDAVGSAHAGPRAGRDPLRRRRRRLRPGRRQRPADHGHPVPAPRPSRCSASTR